MIRRFGFVVLVMALIVSGCGRQVTPDRGNGTPGSGLPPGFISVTFKVAQPFNFAKYSYLIVFNTSGDGYTPLANGQQSNYRGYSVALVVDGSSGSFTARAAQYYRPPGTPSFQQPSLQWLSPAPQQLQSTISSDGTSFTLLVDRHVFLGIATPTPGPTATASPTASPTATPTGSPSPSPSPTAQGLAWNFNYFVAAGSTYTPVDSLGSGGATDTSYQSPSLPVTQAFDTGIFNAQLHVAPPSDPSATIVSGEIANNP